MAELTLDPTLLSDEEVVTRVLDGEKRLFEVLVQRHSKRLMRVVTSILRNSAEAEDAVQDAFLSAYEHLAQFEGRAKFATWLSRIALYRSYALAGRNDRHVSLDEEFNDERPIRTVSDPRPSPEQQAYISQLSSLLSTAVAELPENYRSVLIMREMDGVDTDETARRLHLSRTNVKVRLHRARAMVRARYDKSLESRVQASAPHARLLAAAS